MEIAELIHHRPKVKTPMAMYCGPSHVWMQPGDDILTPQALADWLQIPISTVRDLCRTRSQTRDQFPLPFLKIGKRTRFNRTEVLSWLSKLEAARKI
jgi:predicted DNA-binding transcriptional regulator AlpA